MGRRSHPATLHLTTAPTTRAGWAADVGRHLDVLFVLAKKDFQTRYKRASFGVLWSVALPVLQGGVIAAVFSHVARFDLAKEDVGYGAYVLAGMAGYAYVAAAIVPAATAIVDGAGLAEKVWFPRAVLVVVPCASNAVSLVVGIAVALGVAPLVGGTIGSRSLLAVPAASLLVAFTLALGLVLGALQVYFRDVRFLLQALLLVSLYLSPVIYPRGALGRFEGWVDLNPLTGPLTLLHAAVGTEGEPLLRPLVVTAVATLALLAVGIEVHRRRDRLFVDLL